MSFVPLDLEDRSDLLAEESRPESVGVWEDVAADRESRALWYLEPEGDVSDLEVCTRGVESN